MRSVAGVVGVAVALVVGPYTSSWGIRTAPAAATPAPTPSPSPSPSPSPGASWNPSKLPAAWKDVTSLRVLPAWPRQNNDVRLMVHCPTGANHATVGSTAFALKGSRRVYREVGIGLSDRGLGRDTASISYYALPGPHTVTLRCVKVTIDHATRIRKIRVLSRVTVSMVVRRFDIAQFFACVPIEPC
ncbi:hypothetical protein [Streptosporangium saharense]|uniref:hypothetical protein n=1 Tax=Streptosporangium saharense TaxID=1706840 RepID=UPI0034397CF7